MKQAPNQLIYSDGTQSVQIGYAHLSEAFTAASATVWAKFSIELRRLLDLYGGQLEYAAEPVRDSLLQMNILCAQIDLLTTKHFGAALEMNPIKRLNYIYLQSGAEGVMQQIWAKQELLFDCNATVCEQALT